MQEKTTKTRKNGRIPLLCKVGGMTTGSHECLAACLGLAEEDVSEKLHNMVPNPPCTNVGFQVGENKHQRPRNAHVKRQFNFVKRHITMNLPKTWWKTIQGSRLSSSQRRTCFPKTQARKGPSGNRAKLHLELPGTLQNTEQKTCSQIGRFGSINRQTDKHTGRQIAR